MEQERNTGQEYGMIGTVIPKKVSQFLKFKSFDGHVLNSRDSTQPNSLVVIEMN